MSTVAVVGLGGMGAGVARNLVAAGHQVTVWNRSPSPVSELAAAGAHPAADLGEAFAAGTVFSMLANDKVVTDVLLDPDLLAGAPESAVHVNLATVSPELAKRAAALHAEHGVGYLAAPVFGRTSVAEAGRLTILAAGDSALVERVQPFFDVIGARTWLLGENPEKANIVKVIGNFLLASAIQSLGAAITIGERNGVDAQLLTDVLGSSLFPGPVYAGYGTIIAERDYEPAGFSSTLGLKDVDLAMDIAAEANVPLPIGEVLRAELSASIAEGRAAQDWASVAERYRT